MAEPLFSTRKLRSGMMADIPGPDCAACGLDRKCKSPRMGVTGEGREGVLFLAEAPGKQEDEEGMQLVGDTGGYLRELLRDMGLMLDLDCWKINAVNCRPTDGRGNRTPTDDEVAWCRPMVMSAIQRLRPRKIISLGTVALDSLLAHRWQLDRLGTITGRWRGQAIPDRDLKAWLYPTFHPSYILRSGKDEVLAGAFRRDLEAAIGHDAPPVDWDEDPERAVKIITDPHEIKKAIKRIRDMDLLTSIDYETTGLKPYDDGHDIHTASMANGHHAISFPFYPEIRGVWKRFLRSDAPKTAHNMKFEELWSRVILDTPVNNWRLCTMQAAHVMDNRGAQTSLEFLGYSKLGWMPWGLDMARYKKSPGKDANAFNSIREAPIRSLLLYGGLDSLVQNRLAAQMIGMGYGS